MCSFARLLCCVVLACVASVASSATKRLNFNNYQTEHGLTSNYVSDLAVDVDGFLWVSTDYGLNRFDGAVFRAYQKDNYPSLRRNDILQVATTTDGDVIVSGYNGFFQRYNPETDRFDSIFSGNYFETVAQMCYGYQNKEMYAIASDGLYVQHKDTRSFSRSFLPKAGNMAHVKYVLGDEFGRYWLAFNDRVAVWNAEGESLYEFPFAKDARLATRPLMVDLHTGRIMVCCVDHVVDFYRFSANGDILHERTLQLPFSNLVDVQVASDGSFWFATDGDGLWMSPSEPASSASLQHVLPYGADADELSKVYCLLADNKGNVWAGTQNSGLWHYSVLDRSSSFSSADLGLPRSLMHGFCQLPSGNMLVAADGVGVCEFSEKAGLTGISGVADGLNNLNMTGVACDGAGNILATGWGGGLVAGRIQNGRLSFTNERMKPHAASLSTMSHITTFSDGQIWVSVGGEGVYFRETSGDWQRIELRYPDVDNIIEYWPSFCFQGNNGEVWIASSFAMWNNRTGVFKPFDVATFVNTDCYVVNDGVAVPGYGVVLATRTGLLAVRDGDSVFSQLDVCPLAEVLSVTLDKHNLLWAVVDNSIWCFDLKAGSAKRFPQDFDARGKNFFLKHSKFCSQSGRVYFGTKDGFFSLNPDNYDQTLPAPNLYISRLMMDGELVAVPPLRMEKGRQVTPVKTLTLPYGHSSFAVSVDMPDYTHNRPSLVYRLKGDDWMPLGPDQRIAYSYLPEGDYLLEVKTVGSPDDSSLRLQVEVEGPWWSAWWFRLLVCLVLLSFAAWKLYSLNRDKRRLQKMVDERTHELQKKSELVEHRNQELNAALTTKDRLMTVVAHDLKNPVFAIVGALEGLRKRNGILTENERASVLDNMIDRAQTLQSELSKLLVWATSNQGEMEFRPASVDLADVISSDVDLARMQAETKGVELVCDVNLPNYSYIDGRMVSTAIRNVLGNSLKFTPEGKNVSVRAWQVNGESVVEIADQGVGLSADKLAHLLAEDVNVSTSGTNGEKGTGLGVGLAKYYVTANGGSFAMESVEGVGTTTRMSFPATDIIVARSSIAQTSGNLSFVVDNELLEGNTVLVVDDDPLIAQNVKAMLDGYVDVLVAQNGQEALAAIDANNIDIVVSDVEMPVMNGIEMSNALASNPKTNHIPVLFLSAKTGESDRLLGLLTGAVDYIPKPFNQSELLIKLNNILALRQRNQQRLLSEQVELKKDEPEAQTAQKEPEDKMNPFLQQVLSDIKLHYAEEDYGVEQMAANLFTTRITLYRKVKSLSGQNPSDWLNDFRLNKAELLLKQGEVALQDVAFAVGFSDHAYFARRFKARFGCSPKDVKQTI